MQLDLDSKINKTKIQIASVPEYVRQCYQTNSCYMMSH
jgi:hypothetical protein